MTQANAMVRILLVGEARAEFDQMPAQLRTAGFKAMCQRVESAQELKDFLELQDWDFVLAQHDYAQLPFDQTAGILEHIECRNGLVLFYENFEPSLIEKATKAHAIDIIGTADICRLPMIIANNQADDEQSALVTLSEQYRTLLNSIDTPVICLQKQQPVLVNQAYCDLVQQTQAEVLSHPLTDNIQLSDGGEWNGLLQDVNAVSKVSAINIISQGEFLYSGAIEARHILLANEDLIQILFHIRREVKSNIVPPASELQFDESISDPEIYEDPKATSLPSALRSDRELTSLLEDRIQGLRDSDDTVGLAHIKIDNYFKLKQICGPEYWPSVSAEIAHCVVEALPDTYIAAKFSDSAYILLADEDAPELAKENLENLTKSIAEKAFNAGETLVPVSISVGIDKVSNLSQNANSVLSHAENACAVAAERGGNQVNLHDAEGTEISIKRDLEKVDGLRQALVNDRFKLLYQPIASLHAQPKEYYQVLLRLQAENSTDLLTPQSFMEAASRGKLMPDIDRWVIIHAIERLKEEHKKGNDISFFILQSGDILKDPNYIHWMQQELKESPKLANKILFEFTVKDAAQNLRFAIPTFKKIRSLGCKLVLSRYNKNRESEICSKHAHFDMMKLDGSLLHKLAEHKENQNKIQELVNLADSKNVVTLAPYVEDANSLATLWRFNIGYTQGYFLQEPSDLLDYDFSELM